MQQAYTVSFVCMFLQNCPHECKNSRETGMRSTIDTATKTGFKHDTSWFLKLEHVWQNSLNLFQKSNIVVEPEYYNMIIYLYIFIKASHPRY